jgi:cation transport ATPase
VVGAPFEGAVLLTLFSISTTLEERALGRARRAIEALMALRPETALRKDRGRRRSRRFPPGSWPSATWWCCAPAPGCRPTA